MKIWKTVKLGTNLDALKFCNVIRQAGKKISEEAEDIMNKQTFSGYSSRVEVELVKISVADLGFKEGATCGRIYKKAAEIGLELCPKELGPKICLLNEDSLSQECLLIAMEPIVDSNDIPRIFYVKRLGDDKSGIFTHYGASYDFWDGSFELIFTRRK